MNPLNIIILTLSCVDRSSCAHKVHKISENMDSDSCNFSKTLEDFDLLLHHLLITKNGLSLKNPMLEKLGTVHSVINFLFL